MGQDAFFVAVHDEADGYACACCVDAVVVAELSGFDYGVKFVYAAVWSKRQDIVVFHACLGTLVGSFSDDCFVFAPHGT